MATVYLETSLISACVSTRTDAASIYRRETSVEWLEHHSSSHELFISSEVVAELQASEYPLQADALALAQRFPLLAINEMVLGCSAVLVREKVMPGPLATGDAVHVAAACVHEIDYLLTWNVRHLANRNKLQHLQAVCTRLGFLPPQIITPDLLWENPS